MADDFFAGFPGIPDWDMQPPETQFDYARWKPNSTMHICNCPWGTSEVQVGNRSIIGQGNVVHFGSATNRDKWFDANAQGITFNMFYRGLDQTEYRVELPFDVMCGYNYMWFEYTTATSDGEPIASETQDGLRRAFFFIRQIKSDATAPNCTRVTVLPDYWTTFVYNIKFTGLKLRRGHWAVKHSADVDTYLADPIANTRYLTTPDVEGRATKSHEVMSENYNTGDVYAVLVISCNVYGEFAGAGNINALEPTTWQNHGGFMVCAMTISNFIDLCEKCEKETAGVAQLYAAFRALYYVPEKYIELGDEFDFLGWESVTAYKVKTVQNAVAGDKLELTRDMFGYPDEYAEYTKLYTSPYAYVQVHIPNGGWDVPVECVHALQTYTNFAPQTNAVGLYHTLTGAYTADDPINHKVNTYNNDNDTHTYYASAGCETYVWASPLRRYMICGDASLYYQAVNYNSRAANEQNFTKLYGGDAPDYPLADGKELTDYALQYRSNYLAYRNQTIANAANSSNTATVNSTESSLYDDQEVKMGADAKYDKQFIAVSTTITNDETAAITATNNSANTANAATSGNAGVAQAQTSAVAGLASTAVSAAGGAASGALAGMAAGPVGAVVGGIGGFVGSAIGGVASGVSSVMNAETAKSATIEMAQCSANAATECANISISKNSDLADATKAQIDGKTQYAMGFASAQVSKHNSMRSTVTSRNNSSALSQTENSSKLADKYVAQNYKVQKAVFDATPQDYKLNAGGMTIYTEGDNAAERYAVADYVDYNVQTMSDADIKRVGDEFALHGYTCDTWVYDADGIDLTVMPRYTYWECTDIMANYYMPDEFADRIKMLLLGGIKVYSDPDYVGDGVIYQ